jgi:hypothetical protein
VNVIEAHKAKKSWAKGVERASSAADGLLTIRSVEENPFRGAQKNR